MAQILPFPVSQESSPLALFVLIGSAHKKLADLYAAGRLRAQRVVVDASRVGFQQEFLKTLRDDGIEVVLDTELAELSSPRKFSGHARHSPWVKPDWQRPFEAADFNEKGIRRLADKIAEFAVRNELAAVLSPTHFLGDRTNPGWFEIDRAMCLALRASLDRLGGSAITIDYPVILSNAELKDVAVRGAVSTALADLPIENIWIRTSGMDVGGGPLKTIRFLSSLERFHNVGRPIVADYLGGLTSLAALAFGTVSGVAHGVAEKERFDASDWHLPPEPRNDDEGFGPVIRVEVPDLGKAPTKNELELLAGAPGGRRICSCPDRQCCPHGLEDMLRDPRSHAAFRATAAVAALENIPPSRREGYFLEKPLASTVRTARAVAKLRPTEEDAARLGLDGKNLIERYIAHSHHMDSLASALENYHERRSSDMPRAKIITSRQPAAKNPKEAKK
ncbi:MAG: hypothetical protein HY834_11470 [Devosia nanyangense]|uniref:Uncharacterized protein n=1 Tax=Devosia nanyangense TaxID=1228055 RepID=A0A933L4U4_9HYPH|nr:hypothetical protein [Devosia nanyangense]